jgi:hypothetical protein
MGPRTCANKKTGLEHSMQRTISMLVAARAALEIVVTPAAVDGVEAGAADQRVGDGAASQAVWWDYS